MALVTVTGLGFGDEGKGAIVDALARDHVGPLPLVVRHNGGGQAAHNVHVGYDTGVHHHTFSQLGSASFLGCPTHLSSHFLLNPVTFLKELDEWSMTTGTRLSVSIDPMAKVVTPYHMAANAAREDARGEGRHGSCAQGVGELVSDSLHPVRSISVMRAGLLREPSYVRTGLDMWRHMKAVDIANIGQPVPDWFWDDTAMDHYVRDFVSAGTILEFVADIDALNLRSNIIFEGAQGVLLDEDYGFHPHTTWSHTTLRNVARILDRVHGSARESLPYDSTNYRKIGVTRTYMTRHGAGPFMTEDPTIDRPEPDNDTGTYQGEFRIGHFDMVALRYAILVSGVNELAVTHLDYLSGKRYVQVCTGYRTKAGTVIRAIPVLPPDDFDARSELTEKLFEMSPLYEWWPARAFLSRLSLETGLSVRTLGWGKTSHGPNTTEARLLSGQDGFDPYGNFSRHLSDSEQFSQ